MMISMVLLCYLFYGAFQCRQAIQRTSSIGFEGFKARIIGKLSKVVAETPAGQKQYTMTIYDYTMILRYHVFQCSAGTGRGEGW